jgi:hypothetical protein
MKLRPLSSKQYHLRAITDAFDTFENRETTVSHIFRKRHAFLGNRTYGEAMFQTIRKRFAPAFSHALEIGGGRGDFAREFMAAWTKASPNGKRRYTIVDLSPALLRSQRRLIGRPAIAFHSVQADAEQFPLRHGSFSGLVIANEMIADLDVWRLARAQPHTNQRSLDLWRTVSSATRAQQKMVRTYLRRYPLDALRALRTALFPIGLARLLETLYQVVDADSRVVITEYFDLDGGGTVWKFHKHRECSLSLPIVCELARRAGFSVESLPLTDFLSLRVTRPVATRTFLTLLRDKLGHKLSVTLPYSPGDLRRILVDPGARPGGLFTRIELEEFLLSFHVVILRKRRRPSAADFHSRLILQREPDIIKLRARHKEPYLIMTFPPYTFVKLNETGEAVWDALDGKTDIRTIARWLSRRNSVPVRRAQADTLALLKALARRHFVHMK